MRACDLTFISTRVPVGKAGRFLDVRPTIRAILSLEKNGGHALPQSRVGWRPARERADLSLLGSVPVLIVSASCGFVIATAAAAYHTVPEPGRALPVAESTTPCAPS